MAELIAAVVEAFVAMIAAIAEALPAILEGLIYVAAGSFTIIAYAISPQFRERKRRSGRKGNTWIWEANQAASGNGAMTLALHDARLGHAMPEQVP